MQSCATYTDAIYYKASVPMRTIVEAILCVIQAWHVMTWDAVLQWRTKTSSVCTMIALRPRCVTQGLKTVSSLCLRVYNVPSDELMLPLIHSTLFLNNLLHSRSFTPFPDSSHSSPHDLHWFGERTTLFSSIFIYNLWSCLYVHM